MLNINPLDIIEKKREGRDLNPRVLADIGLAIQRLAGLGHLRLATHNTMRDLKLL